ncbi:MAG: TonB-dependent receptor [Prevotella sp.]|nr:TonB-dependent receptor [Prevotella sp.]MCH4182645.1 TonB-dependent receptor [Prevotella sp.]MCH4241297.1 TonB-dependent receptor [Prevotella sp.]
MKQEINVKRNISFLRQKRAGFLRLTIMMFLLLFVCNQMNAQSVFVKGCVKDSHGESVIGASVYPKGNTAKGTISDLDGNFSLKSMPNDTVVVSYIGFQTYKFIARPNHFYNITLRENAKTIGEVVVVGYGIQKKVSVTGAISTVNMEDLKKSSSASFDNALAGRITGLISTQSGGGQPGVDGASLYLRGISSINGSSPLILVDGVKRSNILSEIDPNEVESISVLKDASATAVFGVRGANGVIIITTKRGKEGKAHISASVDQSFTSFCRVDPHLHSWDYMALKNEALKNDGLAPEYSDDVIAKFKNPLWGLNSKDANYAQEVAARKYLYCDHYYMKEMFRKYTPQTKVNVNISGGTGKFSYFYNAGYIHQGGNLKTEPKSQLGYDPSIYMNRGDFRSNIDYNITNSLKAQLNIGTYIQTTNMPGLGANSNTSGMIGPLFYNAELMKPCQAGPATIEGHGIPAGIAITPSNMDTSPFEDINRRGFYNYTEVNLTSQLTLDWDLSKLVTKGLDIKGMISYDSYGYTHREGEKREITYYVEPDYNVGTFVYSLNNMPSALSLSRSYDSNYSINAQASINYHRIFGAKHDVGAMVLGQRDYWESGAQIPFNVIGLSARATYGYDSRYLAEFDMGYNGSEQFAPSKRFGFFPAFSFGWIMSNESFLKKVKWLDNLKLRYSNGKVGNDQMGGSRFLYMDNIQVSGTSYVGGLGTPAIRSISQGLLGNKKITWELAHKQNWGIDVTLFNSLSFSLDYFNENRSHILISRGSVPGFQGIDLSYIPKVNAGKMKNHGFEGEISYNKDITKDWHISIRANYATNKNKVTFYDEAIKPADYCSRYDVTGYSWGQCFGYKIDKSSNDGFYVSEDDIKKSGLTYSFGTPRPGDFKYQDLNHDGIIDNKDMVPIKYSAIPGINYGFNFATSYKGFDFSIFFQGLAHYSMYYNNNAVWENLQGGCYFKYQRTAWTPERWANHEKITYPALTSTHDISQQPNDYFIQNRAFLRLKNLEVGYTLPKRSLIFMGITSCRFYISGQNLYCWDHLHTTHLDPEQNNPYGYPITKMFNFGLNINF